jgi:SRSO17 transposase
MIERTAAAAVPFAWVAGDEVYGGNGPLRAWLEARRIAYVLAVACDHRVPAGAGHTIRADQLASRLPGKAWQRLSAGPAPKDIAGMTGPGSPSATPARDPGTC